MNDTARKTQTVIVHLAIAVPPRLRTDMSARASEEEKTKNEEGETKKLKSGDLERTTKHAKRKTEKENEEGKIKIRSDQMNEKYIV